MILQRAGISLISSNSMIKPACERLISISGAGALTMLSSFFSLCRQSASPDGSRDIRGLRGALRRSRSRTTFPHLYFAGNPQLARRFVDAVVVVVVVGALSFNAFSGAHLHTHFRSLTHMEKFLVTGWPLCRHRRTQVMRRFVYMQINRRQHKSFTGQRPQRARIA